MGRRKVSFVGAEGRKWTNLGVAERSICRRILLERLLVILSENDGRAFSLREEKSQYSTSRLSLLRLKAPVLSLPSSARLTFHRRVTPPPPSRSKTDLAERALLLLVERPEPDRASMASPMAAHSDGPVLHRLCTDEADRPLVFSPSGIGGVGESFCCGVHRGEGGVEGCSRGGAGALGLLLLLRGTGRGGFGLALAFAGGLGSSSGCGWDGCDLTTSFLLLYVRRGRTGEAERRSGSRGGGRGGRRSVGKSSTKVGSAGHGPSG